jgi:hypothetical protein
MVLDPCTGTCPTPEIAAFVAYELVHCSCVEPLYATVLGFALIAQYGLRSSFGGGGGTGWVVPDTRYSATTSKHQGTVRRSIPRDTLALD